MDAQLTAPVITHSTFDMMLADARIKQISNDLPFVSAAFGLSTEGKKLLLIKVLVGLNTNSMESFRLIVTEIFHGKEKEIPTLGVTLRYDQDVEAAQRYLWFVEVTIGNIDQIERVHFMVDSSDDYEDPKVGSIAVPE